MLERINYETISICNEPCGFCFATFVLPKGLSLFNRETLSEKDLSTTLATHEVKNVLDQAAEIGIRQFLFGGGDPFIRRDMPELLRYAKNSGLHVLVDTNCLILSSRKDLLSEVESSIHKLGISLDAPTDEQNFELRQTKNAHKATLDVLERSKGRSYKIKVNTVVTKVNIHCVPGIARLLANYEVSQWSIDQFIPAGRGARNRATYEVSENEYNDVVRRATEAVEKSGLPIIVSGGTSAQKSETVLLIAPQGVAYVPVGAEKHYIASVRNTSLLEIIQLSGLNLAKHRERYDNQPI